MGKRMVIKDLEWNVDYDAAVAHLHVLEDDADDFKDIYDTVYPLLEPVVYIGEEQIESNDGHKVVIGGQTFESRVVAVNLEACSTVYPYVMTSGRRAYEYALSLDDELYKFWAHEICEMALKSMSGSLVNWIYEKLGTKNAYSVNPGSVIDWSITQQRQLFELLGNVYENTGIILEESCLMRPIKSGSGIYYVSDKHFASCMLCARSSCPHRRAEFDPEMFKSHYGE